MSANPLAMAAGLATLKQLDTPFYTKLKTQTDQVLNCFREWLTANEFSDYKFIQFESLFWPVPSNENITTLSQIPSHLTDRFFKLFKQLLDKGIYLSPNAYEVGFGSIAHDESVLKDLKQRLWS